MNINQFHTRLGQGVALVDFSASWCDPCKAQKPIFKAVSKKYKEKARLIEMNVDENRELASTLMVQSIPTLVLFRNGREIKRFVGIQTEEKLSKCLDEALTCMTPSIG